MFCLRLVEKFCEQRCVVGLVPEVTNVPPTEAFCRKAATEWQAGKLILMQLLHYENHKLCMLVVNEQVTLDDLHYVAFCDFTKLGTFNQQSLNHHA